MMKPIATGPVSLASDIADAKPDAPANTADDATASRIVGEVRRAIAGTLADEKRQMSPEALSAAFLRDVLEMVSEQNIEMSEEDYVELLREAIAVETSVRTSEMIRGSVKTVLEGTPAWQLQGWR